jgi:hypothetical protein
LVPGPLSYVGLILYLIPSISSFMSLLDSHLYLQ